MALAESASTSYLASRTSLLTQDQPSNTGTPQKTIAILPLSGTTVTATAVSSYLAVVDGTTISFRADGITLSDGQVFSLGYDGLVDSTTTGKFEAVSNDVPATATTNMSTDVSTPTGNYDSTHHPTSQVTLTNPDESTFSTPNTPTETGTSYSSYIIIESSTFSMGLTDGTQVTSTATGGGTTITGPGTERTTLTGTESTTGRTTEGTNSAGATTTGGSGAQSHHESGEIGVVKFLMLGLGLLGVFGL